MKTKNTPLAAYSAESAGLNSGSKGRVASRPSGSRKSTRMLQQSLNDTGLTSQTSATSPKSTGTKLRNPILSAVGSPAKTSALRGKAQASKKEPEVDYGKSTTKPYAFYDQGSSLWKTYQRSLSGDFLKSSATLPKSGMMRNGSLYAQVTSVRPTRERGSLFLLPTPKASDSLISSSAWTTGRTKEKSTHIATRIRFNLPTITANEGKGSGKDRFIGSPNFRASKMSEGLRTSKTDPIYLNPSFAEVVMGFPIGWTALNASETPSSPKSRKSSAKPSSRE